MKVFLKNIGGIGEATVEINGISVIAGENNTGKSTVGKALFSVFNSFFDIEAVIKSERLQSIRNILVHGLSSKGSILLETAARYNAGDNVDYLLNYKTDYSKLAGDILIGSEPYMNSSEKLKEAILNAIIQDNTQSYMTNLDEVVNRIADVMNISDNDIIKTVLNRKLDAEFNGQVSNIYNDTEGEIKLRIKDQWIVIKIQENHVTDIDYLPYLLREVIYLDDPFVLDQPDYNLDGKASRYTDHKEHLRNNLFGAPKKSGVIDEIIVNRKFNSIYEKVDMVCSGDITKNNNSELEYRKKGSDKGMDIRNLSTGLKTFVILKMLLQNGMIDYNGIIILDEPEIHLHPEWQLIFAELIVLIQKEFGMHVLLNTHSPYFLNAIEVYAAKYDVADQCQYYLAYKKDDLAYIDNVTDNIELIYQKLARPLQKLENARYEDDQF